MAFSLEVYYTYSPYRTPNRGSERQRDQEREKEDDLDVHLSFNSRPFDRSGSIRPKKILSFHI